MMDTMKIPVTEGFEMTISADEDGTVEALYLYLSDEPVTTTKEIDGDALMADYDKNGKLVGIEILAPVSIATVVDLVDQPQRREALARFLGGLGLRTFTDG